MSAWTGGASATAATSAGRGVIPSTGAYGLQAVFVMTGAAAGDARQRMSERAASGSRAPVARPRSFVPPSDVIPTPHDVLQPDLVVVGTGLRRRLRGPGSRPALHPGTPVWSASSASSRATRGTRAGGTA